MKSLKIFCLAAVAVGAVVATSVFADGRKPGSVLIFPVHRSGAAAGWITVVNVTNINTLPQTPVSFGGSTLVHYDYVNTIPNPQDEQMPLGCVRFDRVEFLTPADTLSVLTSCHNAVNINGQQGYLVVSAQDPAQFGIDWSHNFLMGSELVLNGSGTMYSMNALPFAAIPAAGLPTDLDFQGDLDFDGVEYEPIPDTLYIDSFLAVAQSQLALLNLTGGPDAVTLVQMDVWNDNEFPLSTTKLFKCWFDVPLVNVSPLFDQFFLRNNTPNDPNELDVNCDNLGDFETGWARINGVVATTSRDVFPNPALLGAITTGPAATVGGGHLLWESNATQANGSF